MESRFCVHMPTRRFMCSLARIRPRPSNRREPGKGTCRLLSWTILEALHELMAALRWETTSRCGTCCTYHVCSQS